METLPFFDIISLDKEVKITMNENLNKFLESQKKFQKMVQNPMMDKFQENHRRMEQIANPEWLTQVNVTRNRFTQMNFDSYISQLNQMTIQPMEFINQNQTMFNQIQAIHNRLENLMVDLTDYYSNDEKIPEGELAELQTSYSDFSKEIDSLKIQGLTDEQRSIMIEKLQVMIDNLKTSSEVAISEHDNVINQKNRESQYDRADQQNGENQHSDTDGANQQHPMQIFIQSTLSNLTDPKWQGEKLAEAIVASSYGLAYELFINAQTGQINIFTLVMTFRFLTYFFKKEK